MGVRDNHTKYEPETQWWWPGTVIASAGPPFQNLQCRAKISLFLLETALEHAQNGQKKGNCGYSTHAARLHRAEGPSKALQLHNISAKGPQKTQTLCTLAADSPKPKTDHILGYVAQSAISSSPNPPANTHFWWFPPLKIALTDA